MEEQQAPINVGAHHGSGKRTRLYSINKHFCASPKSCAVDRRWALRSIVKTLLTRHAAMPVHCYHKPGSSEHARLAGTVSSGRAIKSDVVGKAGQESPRFRIVVLFAVEFFNALFDSAVGTCIIYNVAVSLAVAVQMYGLLCNAHADTLLVLSRTGLAAVYIVLASLYTTLSESQIPRTPL
eukprot:5232017-Pleurochrysis_carterae.AAC.3